MPRSLFLAVALALGTAAAARPGPTRQEATAAELPGVVPAERPTGASDDFLERFVLAADRAALLAELIPGTEPYYLYSVLVAQQQGRLAEAERLLADWRRELGETTDQRRFADRQALLDVERAPAAAYEHLERSLGLRYDHRRVVPGAPLDLPTRLDPAVLDPDALLASALRRHRESLRGLTDEGLPLVVGRELSERQLAELLERLDVATLPGLVPLVLRDLEASRKTDLGDRAVHRALTLAQLEALVDARPALLNGATTVTMFLRRLQPSADVDVEWAPAERAAYLERLTAFVRRLGPAFVSLKAHVLYHRLADDLARGVLDRALLREYLALPRPGGYVAPRVLEGSRQRADLGAEFETGLAPVRDDLPLVRAYLLRLLARDDSPAAFEGLIEADHLRRLFAEAKLLAGVGDRGEWYALLDSEAAFQALERRVELDFAPTQARVFGARDDVTLELDVKNVERLLVKVYALDAYGYYRTFGRELDTTIELDGQVPNAERTLSFDAPPIRRVRRTVPLPEASGPGTYVVELVGGGVVSRAVLRKGTLRTVERISAAGHALRVFDEEGTPRDDAVVWFGGREYTAGESGEVVLPFSSEPAVRAFVARAGERAVLQRFEHRGERYELDAHVHVEREALLEGERARVVVRPRLELDDRQVSLALLEGAVLEVRSRDLFGDASARTYEELELEDAGELVVEVAVPPDLVELEVQLSGEVRPLTGDEPVRLQSTTRSFPLNRIDATAATACPLLSRAEGGWVLDVLGKDGEARPGRAVTVRLTLRDFTEPVTVQLQTDARGRVELGALPGVVALHADGFPSDVAPWDLVERRNTVPPGVTGAASSNLRVPWAGPAVGDPAALTRAAVSLVELRGGAPYRDAFDALALEDGFVVLRGLTPGDYALRLVDAHGPGSPATLPVQVTAGTLRAGWLQGEHRWLELQGRERLQVTGVGVEDDQLVVRLANAGDDARVAVAAARFFPAYGLFEDLARHDRRWTEPYAVDPPHADLEVGIALADEVRYVLERRFLPRFPGNMLDRPGLLLNRWALRTTESHLGVGGGAGGAFGGRLAGSRNLRGAGGGPSRKSSVQGSPSEVPTLDFLADGGLVLANLRPDADGVVRVPLERLGDRPHVRVLALDHDDAAQRVWLRARPELALETTALTEPLEPGSSVAERRRVELLQAGESARFERLPGARVQLYDSLEAVLGLFRTVSGDAELERFAFLVDWPTLSDADKRARYAEYACHELHLFLWNKDRPFFDAVVRPYLANKVEREFLDDWLLEADLAGYLAPWRFERLNALERALLARRVGDAGVRAHLADLLALRPPATAGSREAFDKLLSAWALEGAEASGADGFFLGRGMKAGQTGGAPAAPGAAAPGQPPSETARARRAEASEEADELQDRGLLTDTASEAENLGVTLELQADARMRQQVRTLFRPLDETELFVERYYWHRPIEAHTYDLVPVDPFWLDFARHTDGPFVSEHLVEAAGSLNEMLLALAVLDLPFRAPEHELERTGDATTLRPGGPLLVVLRELGPVEPAVDAPPVLVSQSTYRLDEPKRVVDGREVDATVRDEYVVGVPYGCRVVVTNPTAEQRALEVLVQVPAGAVPVQNGFETRGVERALEPYGTATVEYAFYFPRPGTATHYPALVTEGERRVAVAEARALPVVAEPTVVDTTSWRHVSQSGTLDEVLAFLADANPLALDLDLVAWRMRDAAAFERVLDHLRARRVFAPVLWSYALLHRDERAAREYLAQVDALVRRVGPALRSTLLDVDPIERRTFQRMEFDPFVLARTYPFAGQREVTNDAVAGYYRSLLHVLAYVPRLEPVDWMELCTAYLLQNRTADALGAFAATLPDGPAGPEARLQWDYLRCYLAFYGGRETAEEVRALAAGYAEHPVERWRARFATVVDQLDQAAGLEPGGEAEGRDATMDALAAADPALELAVEGERLTLAHANLDACELRFYPVDVELLFSTHPFGDRALDAFGYVRPQEALRVDLSADVEGRRVLDLPAAFRRANVVVEARGGGIVRRVTSYANALAVRTMDAFGQVQVRDEASGAPLAGVYVKVFARLADGSERFHKDGYTDLRGRFDYVSVSGDQGDVARFALLVLDDERGAEVREVEPPAR